MYCLVVAIYRQIDILIPNDRSIKIPKYILVIVEPFIISATIKPLCDMNTAITTLSVLMCHELASTRWKTDMQIYNLGIHSFRL